MALCRACFNAGRNVLLEGHEHEPCPLCQGAGEVNPQQVMDWTAVRSIIIAKLPCIPTNLAKWESYIRQEQAKL